MAFSSSSPFESYTKEKKKKKAEHVGNGKKLLWYLIIKRIVSLVGWFRQIVKKEKARFLCLMFKMKRFLLFLCFFSVYHTEEGD